MEQQNKIGMTPADTTAFFNDLVKKHKGIFFKIARVYCANETDRQDIIQEMLYQVWRSLPLYNSDYSITTWLYRVCLNTAISYYRKDVKRAGLVAPLDDTVVEIGDTAGNDRENQLNRLEQFIAELREFDKALMILYLEDKSQQEIAETLGITVTNVSTKVGRIKEALRKRFSQINS